MVIGNGNHIYAALFQDRGIFRPSLKHKFLVLPGLIGRGQRSFQVHHGQVVAVKLFHIAEKVSRPHFVVHGVKGTGVSRAGIAAERAVSAERQLERHRIIPRRVAPGIVYSFHFG